MPASKKTSAYPAEYPVLFETALKDRVLVWERPTNRDATASRFKLYKYLDALEREDPAKSREFRAIRILINGNKIIMEHRDFTEESQSIRNLVSRGGNDAHEEGGQNFIENVPSEQTMESKDLPYDIQKE